MRCKLCLENKEIIQSHIIPKVFFEYLYPESRDGSLLMIGKNKFTKRRPVGSYEKLLCKECDQSLGVYDNYAKKLLLDEDLKYFSDTDIAYEIDEYDYDNLKLFFISLLWRASVSDREEFGHINAGPFEERLREMIILKSTGGEDEFSIFITKFDSDNEKIKNIAEKNILFPAKQKMSHLNYYAFYLSSGYKMYIKVDSRPTEDLYKKLILRDKGSLIILRMNNFENSAEYKILLDAVK
jgi:hypothetical protein